MDEARQCPWCERWCLKDKSCNYIFACGLNSDNIFVLKGGCGRSWCFKCGKKFCGLFIDPETGIKCKDAKMNHSNCCENESGFLKNDYCCGGHNSHCEKRWD